MQLLLLFLSWYSQLPAWIFRYFDDHLCNMAVSQGSGSKTGTVLPGWSGDGLLEALNA